MATNTKRYFRGKRRPEVFPIGESDAGVNERSKQTTVNTLSAGGHSGGHHSSMTLLAWQNKKEGAVIKDISPSLRASGGTDIRKIPYAICDSGLSRTKQIRTETLPPLRANTGAGHDNLIVQPFTLTGQDQHGVMIQRPHGYNKGGAKELPCLRGSSMEQNDFLKITDKPINTLQYKGFMLILYETIKQGEYYARTQKRDTITILQTLWKEVGEKAFTEWGFRIFISLHKKKILQQGVHGTGIRCETRQSRYSPMLCEVAFKKISSKRGLRDLWCKGCEGCSSQRWRCPQQYERKFTTNLQELSQCDTQEKEAMQNMRETTKRITSLQQALHTFQEIWKPIIHEIRNGGNLGVSIRRLTPV